MWSTATRLSLSAASAAVVGLILASSAHGQMASGPFRGNQRLAAGLNESAVNAARTAMPATPRTGAMPRITSVSAPPGIAVESSQIPDFPIPQPRPRGPWDPWWQFDRDPFAGFMHGTAEVLYASGDFAVRVQESRLINQQVQQARVDTRRKIFDQWLYERANTPTNQDERERFQRIELRRALTNPSPTELLGATPLNRILDDLKPRVTAGATGPSIPISEDVLKQINLTAKGGGAGNIGALKPLKGGGTLSWPSVLLSETYQREVKLINQRTAEAVKEAEFKGQVDPSRLAELGDAISRLKARVETNVMELTSAQWIEARRFVTQLEQARLALSRLDVANSWNSKFTPRSTTVQELVQELGSKGLEFAPAVNGDEAAYMALYNALVAYAGTLNDPRIASNSRPSE